MHIATPAPTHPPNSIRAVTNRVTHPCRKHTTYHLVYRLRYSATQGGLDAWRDGKQIVHYSGPVGYINQNGPYFKFGIYRDPAAETLVVHYKDLRFGDAVVKP